MNPALLVVSTSTLVHLSPVDLVIIIFYFALVLAIGLYLKGQANTGEDFFMAGREMTAWVAGLAFLSANLGSLELMGWAGNPKVWHSRGSLVLDRRHPGDAVSGLVMMPFYHICKTHSVPGYLKLRFGPAAQALASISFAFMTVLMSGINMYAMAVVMRVVLGWDIISASGFLPSRLWFMLRLAVCGRRSSMKFSSFSDLGRSAADTDSGVGGGGRLDGLKAQILNNLTEQHAPNPGAYTHLWSTLGDFRTIPWGSTGLALFSDWARLSPWATGPRTSWSCSASWRPKICAPPNWRPSSARLLK